MAASYKPLVYKTSGGDVMVVTTGGVLNFTGGVLQIAGTAFITSGGGVNIASLTSGDVTYPGRVTATSGINASTGAITGNLSVGGNATMTSGLNATTGSFTGNVTGVNVTLTSGLNATTGVFSSAVTVGHTLAVSSGITGTSGGFSADLAVTSGITALKGVFTSAVSGTTGKFTGNLSALGFVSGITVGTSSGGALTLASLITVKSTAGDPVLYTVEPQAGYICYIRCAASCATSGAAIVTTTGTWDGTNAHILFSSGNTNPQFVSAVGLSTSRWQVLTTAYSTDVTFTNT